jgi:hypothetical protein
MCRDLTMKAFRNHFGICDIEQELELPNQNHATPKLRLHVDILVSWKGQVDQITPAFLDITLRKQLESDYQKEFQQICSFQNCFHNRRGFRYRRRRTRRKQVTSLFFAR